MLERKGVETGFITTDGFQDMLRIRTEGRYDLYDLSIQYPDPLVPRDNCFGAVERIAAHGDVITPLDEDSVRDIAGAAAQRGHPVGRGVPAACLQVPAARAAHRRAAARDRARHLGLAVVQVCPEVREYDRASTTVANAYTRPMMAATSTISSASSASAASRASCCG